MISGTTRLIAHIGYPTETFKSPQIYNPYFAKHGIDAAVVPMGCRAEDYADFLPAAFKIANILGALITMPHKTTTPALLDEVSTAAQVAGACNAVRRDPGGRLIGDLFDGEGFVRGVARQGRQIRGASALIVGAGGVGSAIAASLAGAGAARIGLYDIDAARAEQLAGRLRRHFPNLDIAVGANDPAGWDLAVNATPLGTNPDDPLPMDAARLAAATFVGEVVLSREVTPFVAAARARGCAIQVGLDMLFEQIPGYLEFFGLRPASAEELRAGARID